MFSRIRYCAMCDRELSIDAFKVGHEVPKQWALFVTSGAAKYYTICLKCLITHIGYGGS